MEIIKIIEKIFSFDSSLLAIGSIFVALLITLIILSLRHNNHIKKITYPVYEYIVKKAHQDAQEIISRAIKDASKLRVEAELRGLKAVAEDKVESKHVEETYQKALHQLVEETTTLLKTYQAEIESNLKTIQEATRAQIQSGVPMIEKEMKNAEQEIHDVLESLKQTIQNTKEHYIGFSNSLEDIIEKQFEENKLIVEKGVAEVPKKLDEFVSEIKEGYKEQIDDRVAEEFQKAKQAIELYRKKRMHFLDTYIVDLIEETTKEALGKSLPVKEHANLVYKALEDAQQEGIFSRK